MAARDDTEPWYWQDDTFKFDSESPVEIEKRSSSGNAVHNSEFYKRRRMLQYSGGENDGLALAPPLFVADLESTFESCVNPLIHECEEFMIPIPTSPTSLWYTRNDDTQNPVNKGAEQLSDKWMSRCLEKEIHNLHDEMKVVVPMVPVKDGTGECSQLWQSCEAEVLQGPLTPFSKPHSPGRKSSAMSRFKVKASTPVAYPFALLKPSGAQGDVTLNDINQRILSPPSRPVHQQVAIDDERTALQSGAGLSGKSVVACTKIYTEGNGTITIMRTRG